MTLIKAENLHKDYRVGDMIDAGEQAVAHEQHDQRGRDDHRVIDR